MWRQSKKSRERIALFKSKPRDLVKMDLNGYSDPFCKLSVDDQHWQSTVSLPKVFLKRKKIDIKERIRSLMLSASHFHEL